MAIYRILRNSTFGPQEISKMTTAYEVVLIELDIDRTDPRTETIAAAIVHRASMGERNTRALADFSMRQLNVKAASDLQQMSVKPGCSRTYAIHRAD